MDQLGLTSDPNINIEKSRIELSGYKEPENINYTIVKYEEMFYGSHMALTPAVVKIGSKMNDPCKE